MIEEIASAKTNSVHNFVKANVSMDFVWLMNVPLALRVNNAKMGIVFKKTLFVSLYVLLAWYARMASARNASQLRLVVYKLSATAQMVKFATKANVPQYAMATKTAPVDCAEVGFVNRSLRALVQ